MLTYERGQYRKKKGNSPQLKKLKLRLLLGFGYESFWSVLSVFNVGRFGLFKRVISARYPRPTPIFSAHYDKCFYDASFFSI